MSLKPPQYIPISQIEAIPPDYKWDDSNPYSVLGNEDPLTEKYLAGLSYRAILAYSIGCAEWVVYRLNKFCNDERPIQFLEACWACEMSSDYATPPESDKKDWRGPVRGAIDLSLMTILNTIIGIEEGSPESDAAFAELLPLHVIPDKQPFFAWREKILARLATLYQRDNSNPLGRPVPREALEPLIEPTPEVEDNFVKDFLKNLDKEMNPFLYRI